MIKKNEIISFLLFMLLLIACTATLVPVKETFLGKRNFVEKNYEIGIEKSINIGEAMIKMKDYILLKYSSTYLQPNYDFKLKMGLMNCHGYKDNKYQILGKTVIDDIEFSVIIIPVNTTTFHPGGYIKALIDKKGKMYHKVLNESNHIQVGSATITPKQLVFKPVIEEYINTNSGYINYEIIYNGITSTALNLLYREFTPTDLAKPAFFQNLTFDKNAEMIRFKNLKIRINDANNENIRFTVLEE